MFEIQTNDHHYLAKSIFLGALILVLGVTIWTNVFAQKAIKASLPEDVAILEINHDIVGSGNDNQDSESESIVLVSGDYQGDLMLELDNDSGSMATIESPYSGSISAATGVTTSGNIDDEVTDTAIIYARKIEALISMKGQETRLNMITTMNNFLSKYSPEHPMYRIVMRIVEIITLGDVAHKLEYCTQYEGNYVLELFGMPLNIYSMIRYDSQLQKCQITYQYPDKSVHTCRLNEQQKVLLSRAMKQKQGLNAFNPDWALESVIEGFLSQSVCFESQKPILIVSNAGLSLSGSMTTGSILTGKTVTSWRKNRGK